MSMGRCLIQNAVCQARPTTQARLDAPSLKELDPAMTAGDRLYASYLLSQTGRMTSNIGRNARTEDDRARNVRQSIALTDVGASWSA
ncbi:MAG: hypothetical protein ACRDTG_21150 [Pseudonocardiaceae bacterium]